METVFTYNTASKKHLQQASEWRRCDKEARKKTWQTKDRQGSRKMETQTGRKTTKSKRQRVLQEDKNKRQAERLQRVKDIHIVPGLGTRSFQKNATFLRSFRSS